MQDLNRTTDLISPTTWKKTTTEHKTVLSRNVLPLSRSRWPVCVALHSSVTAPSVCRKNGEALLRTPRRFQVCRPPVASQKTHRAFRSGRLVSIQVPHMTRWAGLSFGERLKVTAACHHKIFSFNHSVRLTFTTLLLNTLSPFIYLFIHTGLLLLLL